MVLLDNGRTRLLADREKRQSLYCIRCGACLNHCPVYRKIGGHNYPWVYSGPIGAIITPQFMGVAHEPWLPFASSLCGACGEVCPVKIDIPKLLLDLRAEVHTDQAERGQGRLERLGFRAWAWVMRHPRLYEMAGLMASAVLPDDRWFSRAPGLLNHGPLGPGSASATCRRWRKSFRQLWRERGKAAE